MTDPVTDITNPYYDTHRSAGEEVSSTFEGRHIQVTESYLVHPDHTDPVTGANLVRKGDPVALFDGVGVALKTAQAVTDTITVDTEGIWRLSVTNTGLNNFTNITVGQVLFITAAGIITDDWVSSYAIFGYALQPITGVGTMVIAVKVHWMYPYWFYDPQGGE
jgi:predicted RecA/RadA family phage recombinase